MENLSILELALLVVKGLKGEKLDRCNVHKRKLCIRRGITFDFLYSSCGFAKRLVVSSLDEMSFSCFVMYKLISFNDALYSSTSPKS